MDYYKLTIYVFIGVSLIHTLVDYPDRLLIYPDMDNSDTE